jgi:ketosteroid isomerase-like protein
MVFALLLLAAVLGQGASAQSSDEKMLLDLARKVGVAWAAHDIRTLERLIDDPYFHTDVAGRTWNRAEWLADVPNFKEPATITFDDVKVRVFGDTAVLTGRNVVTPSVEGKTVERALRLHAGVAPIQRYMTACGLSGNGGSGQVGGRTPPNNALKLTRPGFALSLAA